MKVSGRVAEAKSKNMKILRVMDEQIQFLLHVVFQSVSIIFYRAPFLQGVWESRREFNVAFIWFELNFLPFRLSESDTSARHHRVTQWPVCFETAWIQHWHSVIHSLMPGCFFPPLCKRLLPNQHLYQTSRLGLRIREMDKAFAPKKQRI